MFSLAPKVMSSGLSRGRITAVSAAEMMSSIKRALERILRALSALPSPMHMANSGAPPMPTREAKEVIKVVTGAHTPTPASAKSPTCAMLPTKILSTIE